MWQLNSFSKGIPIHFWPLWSIPLSLLTCVWNVRFRTVRHCCFQGAPKQLQKWGFGECQRCPEEKGCWLWISLPAVLPVAHGDSHKLEWMGYFEEGGKDVMGNWACLFIFFQAELILERGGYWWEGRYWGVPGGSRVSGFQGCRGQGEGKDYHEESGLLHKVEKCIFDRLGCQKSFVLTNWLA